MFIIPINPDTIDLVTKLNNGVRPALDEIKPTSLVFQAGPYEFSQIIYDDAVNSFSGEKTIINILHIP